jgi:hypothetical protein
VTKAAPERSGNFALSPPCFYRRNRAEYMDREGTFIPLIELSENPDKAKQRIAAGFKLK